MGRAKYLPALLFIICAGCGGEPLDLTPRKHFYKNFVIKFEKGTEVVEEWKVEQVINHESKKFKPYYKNRVDFHPDPSHRDNFCCGRVPIYITDKKPEPLYHKVDKVCGLTYPHEYSKVWEGCLLSGGLSWEISMHFVHTLYPGRKEKKDIKWFNKENIK